MIPQLFVDYATKYNNFSLPNKGQFIGNLRLIPYIWKEDRTIYKCLGTIYQNPTATNPDITIVDPAIIVPGEYEVLKDE